MNPAPPDLGRDGRAPGSALDPSGVRRRRPLFWLALAFCAGIFLDDLLQPGLPAAGGLTFAAALAVLAGLVILPAGTARGPILFAVALLAGLSGGALRHALAARFPPPADVTRRTPAAASLAWLEGTIHEVRRAGANEPRAIWTVELSALGSAADELSPVGGRVQLSSRLAGDPFLAGLAEGDRVRLLARLEEPAPATLPEGFDAATHLARLGIRRVGEPATDSVTRVGQAPGWRLDLWLRRLSGALAERNRAALGPGRAALLNALLLGRRDDIEPSDREAFARAGTAHLLAISGLHVQFLAAGLWWVLSRLRWSRRRAGVAVVVFACAYAALSGASPPVVRAALMIGLYLAAHFFFRAADPFIVLGVAALAILLDQPDALFTASFQLSFFAVWALVAVYPTLEAAWRAWRGIPEEWIVDAHERFKLVWARRLRKAVFISFAAWLGTAPAVAWHMGYFNLVSIFSNLIAVPLNSFAMLGGLVVLAAGGGVLADAGGVFADLLLGFNRWTGQAAWASLNVPAPSVILAAAYAAVLVWTWAGRGRTATFPRLAVLLPAALMTLLAAALFRAQVPAPRLTVLDLPRGRAALVETPAGDAALVDCGGEGQGRVLGELLRRQGHSALALLVVTEDSPETLGGARELVERVAVRRAVLPRGAAPSGALRELEEELTRRGVPYGPAELSGSLRGPGDVRWEFLSDVGGEAPPRAGSESLAVRVELAGATVLFAQARSSAGVKRLLARSGDRLRADVLRLTAGRRGDWPAETLLLVSACGARTLIAGEGGAWPEEHTGLDLAALAQARGLRLLCPQREGSLRVGESGPEKLVAYRAGQWREVLNP
jgi:competence protein ComEC